MLKVHYSPHSPKTRPLSLWVDRPTTKSVTHSQCDARPALTLLHVAPEHHRSFARTKLLLLLLLLLFRALIIATFRWNKLLGRVIVTHVRNRCWNLVTMSQMMFKQFSLQSLLKHVCQWRDVDDGRWQIVPDKEEVINLVFWIVRGTVKAEEADGRWPLRKDTILIGDRNTRVLYRVITLQREIKTYLTFPRLL